MDLEWHVNGFGYDFRLRVHPWQTLGALGDFFLRPTGFREAPSGCQFYSKDRAILPFWRQEMFPSDPEPLRLGFREVCKNPGRFLRDPLALVVGSDFQPSACQGKWPLWSELAQGEGLRPLCPIGP